MRARVLPGLVGMTVILPIAAVLIGFWEIGRVSDDIAEFQASQVELAQDATIIDQRTEHGTRYDSGVSFRMDGQLYGGGMALTKVHEAQSHVDTLLSVAKIRQALPPVVIAAGVLSATLSILILTLGAALGRIGRGSRDALVRGFSFVRRVLPAALGLQVLLVTVAFVAAVLFEAAALFRPGSLSSGEIKIIFFALIMAVTSLWMAVSTLLQLRRTLSAFQPDPLHILGRVVSPAEAPRLWDVLEGLAGRLGALRPDHVVVGLTEGFFVTSGPKILQPSGQQLEGRTLYVPLPYLALMREDEAAAVIGHELAHFSGGDTEYSLRFLPIYAGVGRSLNALVAGGAGQGAGSLLLSPALRLGVFIMDRFHFAVRHWSRQREFAADAAGAGATSTEAAARALLRVSAVAARIGETLQEAGKAPETAEADLISAVVRNTREKGFADPAEHLEEVQPHPTDTHPPTRQRLEALGHPPTPQLLAEVLVFPDGPTEAQERAGIGAYFADPLGIAQAATTDFLTVVRRNAAAYRDHLTALVAEVGEEARELREGTRYIGNATMVLGAFFLVFAALVYFFLGGHGASPSEAHMLGMLILLLALGFMLYGGWVLRRGERTFFTLQPDALVVAGLDQPIPWAHVADLDMTLNNRRITTRLLLPPEVAFPQRSRIRKVKLDSRKRIVTVTAILPRKMAPQAFADLIAQYRAADEARRVLTEQELLAASATDAVQTEAEIVPQNTTHAGGSVAAAD